MTIATDLVLALGGEVDPELLEAERAARYCLRSFPAGQECDWQLVGDSDIAVCGRCGSIEVMPPAIALYLRVLADDAESAHEYMGLLRRVREGLRRL